MRESLPPLLFGLVVYVGLVVISSAVPLTEWIVGAKATLVLKWFVLQVPSALLRALPVSLVLAALMAIGRLASDNELVALRAGAIGPARVARWFFVIAGVVVLCTLAVEQWVLPVTTRAAAGVYSDIVESSVGLYTLVGKRVSLDNLVLQFDSFDRASQTIGDVEVQHWNGKRLTLLRARKGRFEGRDLVLTGYSVYAFDFAALDATGKGKPPAVGQLVRLANTPSDPNASLTVTMGEAQQSMLQRAEEAGPTQSASLSQAWSSGRDRGADDTERRKAWLDFHRMVAEPFGDLTLLLVAIPLALLFAGTRGMAFGLALVVTLVWYLFLTFGQFFSQTGALPVWLGPWAGNLVFAVVGAFLLVRRVRLR